jgi:O-antigen/teichoic acid export membrane protein
MGSRDLGRYWSIKLSFVRSVSWNYLGYFFEFVSGLLLLAYVVRRISVHEYGIYLMAQAVAAFLYLLEFGMGNVLVPLYISTFARSGIAEVSRLASTVFLALLGFGAAGAVVLSLAALFIPRLIGLPSANAALAVRVLIVMSVAVGLALPQMVLEQLCQAFHRYDRINQVHIAAVGLRVALTVAVLMAGRGILALATVQVVVSGLRLAGLWAVASTAISGLSLQFRFDRKLLLGAMHMSKWAFGDDISHRISLNAESVILAALGSFEQLALFGVGSRLPAHLYQFAARGLSVLLPTLSQHHAEGDKAQLRATFSATYRVCLTGLVPLAAFAAICAPDLMKIWAGQAYAGAAPVMAWLLMSSLSMVVMLPSDMVLYSHNQIRKAALFSILQTLGKIALALALARQYGALGVAVGIAVWHWSVNLFFMLPAACKVAELSPWELWRVALTGHNRKDGSQGAGDRKGNLIQGGAFVLCAVALGSGMKVLGTLEMFVACILISLLYAGIWANCTALPMWRRARMEASAAL